MRKPKIKKTKRVKSSSSLGQAPGTVTYIGRKEKSTTKIEVYDFNSSECINFVTDSVEEAFKYRESEQITWINIDGLNNTDYISNLGKHYNLHPLTIEDIANTNQRPKIDEYKNYIQIVFKMLYFAEGGEFTSEHVTLILGADYVLTFQESEEDIFNTVRTRLNDKNSRARNLGADYLAYALMDAVVDNYFLIIDELADNVEQLEEDLFNESESDDIIHNIQYLKRQIIRLRKATGPLRDVISKLSKMESSLTEEKTGDYFRDLYDHILYVNENVELYREMIWSLMDMHMTKISNKMNEVMKVLTIIATIFIPLTFIAGIYGMNFDNIPELHYENAYFILWGIMIVIFLGMLYYFRRKKWL